MTPIALTIAGSDSGGGAGVQADLKTFSALGVYGCSVITALTAQNALGVQGVVAVDPGFVRMQFQSVYADLSINAIKIGMLGKVGVVEAVAALIASYKPAYVVVDPVMIATSGDVLLERQAISIMKSQLIPKASIITPNIPEAALLLNCPEPESLDEMTDMIKPLMELGAKAVLLKGGHLDGETIVDLFYDGHSLHRFQTSSINTNNTHGTGCTLSSAVTAFLAKAYSLLEAVSAAKEYITHAIVHADELDIGNGGGPVHHFFRMW